MWGQEGGTGGQRMTKREVKGQRVKRNLYTKDFMISLGMMD